MITRATGPRTAKMAGMMSAAVFVLVLTGYAVYRIGGFDAAGATTARASHRPASHRNDVTIGSGPDEAVFSPPLGSGPRALEEQESECPDDGSGPPECIE